MDRKDWQRIKLAFNECLDLPPDEWPLFVGGLSEPTRGEVEKLLANYGKAENFIEDPAAVSLGAVSKGDDNIGRRIDDYEIKELIGTGGMGNVYLAEQYADNLTHRVAIKLIKRGMDTTAVLKKFVRERQILANLEHPNIARFLDGGSTDDGLPYFVMEFIDGDPITKYCDDNGLEVRERLELFKKVCSAVSHAHQNLIVHRDLKPSNILVTKSGEPKLLDFGIAKLLDPDWSAEQGEQTVTMFKALTPEYASPEQLRDAPVTTVTDVYSLGVILYELLTGERPFRAESRLSRFFDNTRPKIEPVRPSSVVVDARERVTTAIRERAATAGIADDVTGNGRRPTTRMTERNRKLLRGDLDNIILKALQNEPARRYQSVRDFAEDISRHLIGLPVSARPDTYSYRIGKFVSRHRTGAVTAAFVALLLVFATTFSFVQARRANAERAKAVQRFEDVRSLANSLIFELHDSIRDLPGSTPARQLLVSRALGYLDKLAAEPQNDMSLQRELAEGYEKIGDVQGGSLGANLGDSSGAVASYQKAAAIRATLTETPENLDDRYALAMLHSKIFRVMMQTSDFPAAETNLRTAIGELDKLLAIKHDASLYKVTAARFDLELGELLLSSPKTDAAEGIRNYLDAISKAESIPQTAENAVKMPDGLSVYEKSLSVIQMAYRRLGQNAEFREQTSEALDYYQKALSASIKAVAANDPPKPQAQIVLAIGLGNVARMHALTGRIDDALAGAREMVTICEAAAKADPQNHLANTQLSLAYGTLGFVHRQAGDLQSTLDSLNRSHAMQEAIFAKNPSDTFNAGNLGETLAAIGETYEKMPGKSAEARIWYQKSLDLWLGLMQKNQLPAYFAGKIDEQNRALARLK